jgi:hypothetical protein
VLLPTSEMQHPHRQDTKLQPVRPDRGHAAVIAAWSLPHSMESGSQRRLSAIPGNGRHVAPHLNQRTPPQQFRRTRHQEPASGNAATGSWCVLRKPGFGRRPAPPLPLAGILGSHGELRYWLDIT